MGTLVITRHLNKISLIPAAVLLLAASLFGGPSAHAQLATSPTPGSAGGQAVELPEVVVTGNPAATPAPQAKPQPKPVKQVTAPAAAQQTATPPRKVAKAAQAETGDVAGAAPPAANSEGEGGAGAADTDTVVDEGAATASVSATGTNTAIDQVASSVSVVTAAEIAAKQQRTGTDVLRSIPGVQVVQGGGPGSRTALFIRGTESDHSKVYIDGIDVSDPASGGRTFDFGQLTTFDVDRVEVLRGPQSGLYGADALGGVVVVYTKKGEGPPQWTGLVEGGSFGTFNQAAGVSGGEHGFNYAFNVSHYRASAIPVTPKNILLPGTRAFDNDYENWTASTKLGYDISPALTLNGVVRYTQSDLDFTGDAFDLGTFTSRPENFQRHQSNEQLFTRGELVWAEPGSALRSFFGVNYSDTAVDIVNPFLAADSTTSDGDRLKFDWRTIATFGPNTTVTAGADHQNERLATNGARAEEANTGAYVQLQAEPVRNLFVAANLRRDENESFGGVTTWRIAPSYLIDATGTTLKASYGTAFKAPSLVDRFVDFPSFAFFANRNLQPEESTGFDAGFEQQVLDGKLRFGATYFHNDITNLIEFVSDPVTFSSTVVNIGQARTSGVEVFTTVDLTANLRVRADYTFTDAVNEVTGEQLARRPRHKFGASLGWTPIDPLLVTLSVLYTGESGDFDRVAFAPSTLPSYTVVNVAADYKLNETATLFGRIDNLFDEQYQVPDGFDATGIGAFTGVRFKY